MPVFDAVPYCHPGPPPSPDLRGGLRRGPAKPPVDVEFRLGRDNGYVVDFMAFGQGRRAGAVLTANGTRGGGGVYYLRPRGVEVTPRRVSADFGPLGRVSVRFDERRRDVIKAPKGCEGRVTQRYGFFRGGFRFRGRAPVRPRPGPSGAGAR